MNQSKALFVELSDLELEAVAGGQDNDLVDVDIQNVLKNVNLAVNAAVLNTKPSQTVNFPITQK
ncbi:hypothetical protein PCC9214_03452 [Planktothrix tepida]|uniref:Bacteriocin n=2 Tax=Planktothrix TaxID=54304 RepID=A0A1J1LTY2_9CYAN|nr:MULTISPECIES: hypothetical protein [Planktothrix]CAD5945484.1 hypothetical protein NO713_02203 [Planktothrix pseudagardhii]CAD5965295.1 hypothetical protein PCC9214_03452 [Planktothrix tepida]CUR35001.1 hypothetical protein PL9214650440 [Planktothrix tepida PCC 9214]